MVDRPKTVLWVGGSRRDVRSFPREVREVVGYALYLAQWGRKHPAAKPLRGFGGAGVLEIVEEFAGNAYRAVYTVIFPNVIYVLHAFQKKSRRGIQTPREDVELIEQRLKTARADHADRRTQDER